MKLGNFETFKFFVFDKHSDAEIGHEHSMGFEPISMMCFPGSFGCASLPISIFLAVNSLVTGDCDLKISSADSNPPQCLSQSSQANLVAPSRTTRSIGTLMLLQWLRKASTSQD